MMKNFYFGLLAEYFVIILYKLKFYNILAHRKKTYVGELDVIAARRNTIVFIEVKARKQGISYLNLSTNQQRRITRAAELFITKNPEYSRYDIRFDLVVITPYRLPIIIKNAW
jgi:putative endonuclease